jgi:hypothetical protein
MHINSWRGNLYGRSDVRACYAERFLCRRPQAKPGNQRDQMRAPGVALVGSPVGQFAGGRRKEEGAGLDQAKKNAQA